jgi:hypothetical protein
MKRRSKQALWLALAGAAALLPAGALAVGAAADQISSRGNRLLITF